MQQNGQTDRTSIVSRLQAVVGKDRLLMSIKQCLPEAANHQVRTDQHSYTQPQGPTLGPRPSSRLPPKARRREVLVVVHAVPVRSSALKEQQAVEMEA